MNLCKMCKHISACEKWVDWSLTETPVPSCDCFQGANQLFEDTGILEVTCGNCLHYDVCYEWNNNQHPKKGQLWISGLAGKCLHFNPAIPNQTKKQQSKICPFERQNRAIDGAYCIGEECAWWQADIQNCVVFKHFSDAEASLLKEINTVLCNGTGTIIQGGED